MYFCDVYLHLSKMKISINKWRSLRIDENSDSFLLSSKNEYEFSMWKMEQRLMRQEDVFLYEESNNINIRKNNSMKKVIQTNLAPAAIGPYSQAIQKGDFLFASGQLGIDPVTGDFVNGGVKEQAVQVFKNIKAILSEAGYTMDEIVKTTVFLADMADFATVNEIYASQFTGDFPARSAVAVKTLPKNGLVEIEIIAVH